MSEDYNRGNGARKRAGPIRLESRRPRPSHRPGEFGEVDKETPSRHINGHARRACSLFPILIPWYTSEGSTTVCRSLDRFAIPVPSRTCYMLGRVNHWTLGQTGDILHFMSCLAGKMGERLTETSFVEDFVDTFDIS